MYLNIFFILQTIGIYIGIIFLSYYLIRRFVPSGNNDNDIQYDKVCAIFWPFTIILIILYHLVTFIKFCVAFPFKSFNKILDDINKLVSKEEIIQEEQNKDNKNIFLKKFQLIKSEQHTGIYAHSGDIVCTQNGVDLGIVSQVTYDGIPLKIMSCYSPYNNDNEYHCGNYGGIDYLDWYSTGLSLSLSEWARITKEQYEKLNSNIGVYKYFSTLLNYPLGGVSYD